MPRQRSTIFNDLLFQGAAEFISSLLDLGRSIGQAILAAGVRFFGTDSGLSQSQVRALNRVARVGQRTIISPNAIADMPRPERQRGIPTTVDPTLPENYRYIITVSVRCEGQPTQYRTKVVDNPYQMSVENFMNIIKRDKSDLFHDTPDKPIVTNDCTFTLESIRGAYRRKP